MPFGINFRSSQSEPAVLSFRTMRRLIGILGMLLPLLLLSWSVMLTSAHFLLDSISSYYHTAMRDSFVGLLCAVAFFLFAYHGYDILDLIAFKTAALAAVGVAFFPAYIKSPLNPYIFIAPNVSKLTNTVHYICAAIFFLTLAFVSLFLFTKSGSSNQARPLRRRKIMRNRVYRSCGVVMLTCIAGMLVLNLLPDSSPILRLRPVFWLETLALFAFGVSWLTKGSLIIPDKT